MGYQIVPGAYAARRLLCTDTKGVIDEDTNQYYSLQEHSTLIMIFRRQVEERIFEPADLLLSQGNDYLFTSVSIVLSYIEYVGYLQSGDIEMKGKSGKTFRKQFLIIFPECSKNIAKKMYSSLRCGFAHVAMAKNGILVKHDEDIEVTPILFDSKRKLFIINPRSFINRIKNYAQGYCERLSDLTRAEPVDVTVENFARVFRALIVLRA